MANQDRNMPDARKKDAPGRSGNTGGEGMGSRNRPDANEEHPGTGRQGSSELGTEEEGRTGSQGDRDRNRGGQGSNSY
jgi:hypothetical protein